MRLLCRLLCQALPIVFAVTATAAVAVAQNAPVTKPAMEKWIRIVADIPMRDGIKLHTAIVAPEHPAHPLPILLTRSPYGVATDTIDPSPDEFPRLSENGYILAFQDIRGKFQSGGEFVMLRPPHDPHDKNGIDEITDTYDTIDWLIKKIPGNNGRVGMKGVSYDGWLSAVPLIAPHPALKAVSPQAPVADMWLGDDFHHNGAFRLSYAFEYAWMLESGKELNFNWPIDLPDAYDWYLRVGPLSHIDANYLHGKYPSWNDFVAHPNYDSFWQRQAIAPYLKRRLTVPTLIVGGWYDQEDFYGPQRIYAEITRHDPDRLAYLVLGPWNHGGWENGTGRTLGPFDFGGATGLYYRRYIEKPWFDYWLKEKLADRSSTADSRFPHVWTFQTGSNRWVTGEQWPPTGIARNLYLRPAGEASFSRPQDRDETGFDHYLSDPAHPAPYRRDPVRPTYGRDSTWYTWLTDDQGFLEGRPDTLTWKTTPLTEDITISGEVLADLFAATSGTDSDWVVKLLDVYPENDPMEPKLSGYRRMVANEVFRGRFRRSPDRPEAIPADSVQEYRIDLHSAHHVFRKGHRIGIQIQSAWFPLIDRNPQRFVPNIFAAGADDFQTATQRIYRSGKHPTHIVLPVVSSTP